MVYVGQSKNIFRRKTEELRALQKDELNIKRVNKYLWNSWKKHGESNFEFQILEVTEATLLTERELFFCHHYKNFGPGVYNAKEPIPPGVITVNDGSFKKGHIPWHKGKTGVYSEDTQKRMNDGKIGKKFSRKKPYTEADRLAASIRGRSRGLKRAKAVERINPETGEVKEYATLHDAQQEGFGRNCIKDCCYGRVSMHKGYLWSFLQ